MKKIILLLALMILLAACGPALTPTPEAQVTPATGLVTILPDASIKSVRVLAAPQAGAQELGQVLPAERGALLGYDPSGEWLLVQFEKVTGWIPIQVALFTTDN